MILKHEIYLIKMFFYYPMATKQNSKPECFIYFEFSRPKQQNLTALVILKLSSDTRKDITIIHLMQICMLYHKKIQLTLVISTSLISNNR